MPPKLSVLTLTLNEAGALQTFFDRVRPTLDRVVGDYEIVLMDGGSTDDTVAIAERNKARVLRQSRPGYGAAYREGLAACRAEYILTIDADGPHPMEYFENFWSRRHEYSVVMGSRYMPGSADLRPLKRRLLSLILNFAYRALLGCPLTDISGGYRLYRAADLKKINGVGPYYDSVAEIIVLLWFLKLPILELPYRYAPREQGESKARIFKFGFCYAQTLLRLRLNKP